MADDDFDAEFEQIRQRRMAELQGGRGGPDPKDAERKRQMEDNRQAILSQILTADARERLGRISLVKAEKARAVEDMILRAAQSGQLAEKVDENKLIQLLEQIAEKQTKTKITIQRRKFDDDDD